jgi:signal transduction histidine kinase
VNSLSAANSRPGLPRPPAAFPDALVIVDCHGAILAANAQAMSLLGAGTDRLAGTPIQGLFHRVGSCGDSSRYRAVAAVMPLHGEHGPAALICIREFDEAEQAQFDLPQAPEGLTWMGRDRQAALHHLISASDGEWGRIAADIQDNTVRTASEASLWLEMLRLRIGDREPLQALAALEDILSVSVDRLRLLVFDFRPPGLEHGSLGAALRVGLEQMHTDTGIAYQLNDKGSAHVRASTALLIYRTVREALMNVTKHARASTVTVELLEVQDGCLTRVVDHGVGYDPADIERPASNPGLLLIRERVAQAGGWCRIESSPRAGTTVEFWVPLGE